MIDSSIHGHEVIALVAEAQPAITRSTLTEEVARRWGPQARFHTCAHEALTLDELLDFLIGRQKIVDSGSGLRVNMGNVCQHD